jgi:phage terminase large subunit-like protein
LYDVLDTSFGARAEPLFIIISTQSNDPEHILSKQIDDGLSGEDPSIYVQLHAVPDDAPDEQIFDEAIWKLANPALGKFRSLEDMRAIARKAQRMPAEEPKFRNLYLNQRVSPQASLLSRAEWMACRRDSVVIEDGASIYLSLDMSAIVDLSCLTKISADDEMSLIEPIFWKPLELLKEHSKRDFGSGNRRYIEWRDAGYLRTTPGRSIDPAVIAQEIAECYERYNVLGLAYDRWRIRDLLRELDKIGLGAYLDTEKGDGLRLVPWGQGFRDMAPAIDALELAVLERKIAHASNPVLNWNIANAIATVDPAGNRKLDKEKARFRIDGAVSLAMGIGLKARDRREREIDILSLIA